MNHDQPGIAIVGMSARFPGAPDIATFWRNLCDGVESVSRFAPDELEDAFDGAVRRQPNFVAARSILAGTELFDAGFFGMHAREAELTDPQQRIFLECAWEALEDAGYNPFGYPGSIGVIAGCSMNSYFLRNVLGERAAIERFTSDYQVGSYPELLGAGYDFLATRVAYKLNLRGPAMTVQSACSTSLAAVVQACQVLLLRQADMMIAGGVSISFPQKRGYLYQTGGMVSADGHCRTFDAQASGTVFGAGAGAVVLKRLDQALADGDNIFAVIRGFGLNNDGSNKAGFTAPSAAGQAGAIAAAQAMAGYDPRTIRYVECHGTATPLGDPIEFAGLAKVFPASPDGVPYCALGSVKPNIGHLDNAAGISGLIKTALSIRFGKIPPMLNFTAPNPRIPFDGSAFFVNTELCDWPLDGARRAGVSASGVGGTNAHIVLEEQALRVRGVAEALPQLLVVSARSETALAAARTRLGDYLRATPTINLTDVAFTLQSGRRAFPFRSAFVATTPGDAAEHLSAAGGTVVRAAAVEPGVTFMFPGQGAQYVDMGRGLYDRLPEFRAAVDRCAAILEPLIGCDLRGLLYPAAATVSAAALMTPTALAQPLIFSIEYALAAVWMAWGIVPTAMIGHSLGEFVAATLAGVFSLEDALMLVAQRARLMQTLPPGAMLAVRMPSEELESLLVAPVGLAAANSPLLSVAAGPFDAIAALEGRLSERGVTFRRLETSHAFHSPMMDDAIAPLLECIAAVDLSPPRIPYVSGVTGDWITAQQATSPAYWARHCRESVRFSAGIATLHAGDPTVLLEVGPGNALAVFARKCIPKDARATIASSLPGAGRERDDLAVLLTSLGRLWTAGIEPDWSAVHGTADRQRISLPTYPFERTRHWIDAPSAPSPQAAASTTHAAAPTPETTVNNLPATIAASDTGRADVQREIIALLEELSGETIGAADCALSFLELGFDSLFLGSFVQRLAARFGVGITFRQLLGDLPTIAAVTEWICAALPPLTAVAGSAPIAPAREPAALTAVAQAIGPVSGPPTPNFATVGQGGSRSPLESIVHDQLLTMQQLMRDQLLAVQPSLAVQAFSGQPPLVPPAAEPVRVRDVTTAALATTTASKGSEPASRFEVFRPGSTAPRAGVTPAQRAHIAELIARTNERTPRSKALTQRYRAVLADPRVAAGFRAEWKEMVYPIACDRASGSRLWDIDGNQYIDILNGFGPTAFGHSPGFVVDAIKAQLERGFPIGPQTELAGQVAELFCEITGNERVTFCNTGSEAVMAALRIARTVTGRKRVVVFSGAYHGQFDEVLVKPSRSDHRAIPAAPGIPPESVANMVVLPYADSASLDWIREHAAELAAVLVEPVQSRHPSLQPREFLRELRTITQAAGTALVFDEVVTGFRIHAAGMQHIFGIRADLATYGKVAGGGMPIGILAGRARFMDALDGGTWRYGDDSVPEVAPTFFAGTFVRHPLTMAAVLAVLRHIKAEGPALLETLSARTTALVGRLNADLEARGVAGRIESCGSIFYFNLSAEERLSSLLYYHLRLRGVYIQEGFPCFMTTAHSAADVDFIVDAFASSFDELQAVGIFGANASPAAPSDIPLTEEQTEIWLAAQLSDAASCAFNESVTLRLDGPLDEEAFCAAWDAVVARHDALRLTFAPTGESMRVAPAAGLPYSYDDLGAPDAHDPAGELDAAIARDAATPFDLIAGPPVRGRLLRLANDRHAFIFTAHHIVCDGWSMNIVLTEFAAEYTARCESWLAALPEPLAFSTYACRARNPQTIARDEAFWLAAFSEPVAPLNLPGDRLRPLQKTFRGGTRSTHIDAAAYRAIKKAGARNGCTFFTTLLAAFTLLAGRLGETNDVVVGVPAAGQTLLDDETLVGHCVDFLPIRTHWSAGTRLADLFGLVKTNVLDAYEHQAYTLGTLVRKLGLARETNRLPLVTIQFNLERLGDGISLPRLAVELTPNPKAFVNFDLFLNAIESEGGVRLDCDYNSDIYDAATIDRWLHYYRTLLEAIAADATTLVSEVAYRAGEPDVLLSVCSGAAAEYPPDSTVLALFAEQVALRPDAIAATFHADALTYDALDRRANALAHHLRARVGREAAVVGIAVERSLDMLVALLATLKAGYAYVPIDVTHPVTRVRHILSDARISALIIDGSEDLDIAPGGIPLVHLRQDREAIGAGPQTPPAVAVGPESLAYTIYTSGSTGVPKGVEITHGALHNFLRSMAREPGCGPNDTLLAVTTIAFDIAALELFLPLTVGAIVAIAAPADLRDGFLLRDRLQTTRATLMQATPATWRLLLEAGFSGASGIRMLCGGEALRRDLADRLLADGGTLWNMYGPTETTVWSACANVAPDGPIVVGRPIANTQLYVLDAADEPVPLGTTGQLHIGGAGLARGYVRQAELTAEKFVANPFGTGRMYRTGDLARMLPGGSVEVLGRIDEQIKLRGFRIELGEIETTLARHGALAAAAVALRHDAAGEPRLIAYYVERASAATSGETLRAIAAQHLPEYMLPAVYVRLDALPVNANGKLDRAALPAPLSAPAATRFEAQKTPSEIALAAIWAEVLGREHIAAGDDIFTLGADSIQIFAIVARANRQGLAILAKDLTQLRTLRAVAASIDASGGVLVPVARIPKRPLLVSRQQRMEQVRP